MAPVNVLSIVEKLASLFAENRHDRTVLDAVNEIESLTNGLYAKLWQKIMIIDHLGDSHPHALGQQKQTGDI